MNRYLRLPSADVTRISVREGVLQELRNERLAIPRLSDRVGEGFESQAVQGIKLRVENLSDLVFRLALSIGSIVLISKF